MRSGADRRMTSVRASGRVVLLYNTHVFVGGVGVSQGGVSWV